MNAAAGAAVLLAGLLGAGALSACSRAVEVTRAVTYGPDLRYVDPARVSAVMGDLTKAIVALQRQLRGRVPATLEERRSVAALLETLDGLARALDAGGRRSNHPVLDHDLGSFRRLLDDAKRAVRAEPPSYFLAESLVGSCLLCHGKRR